MKTKKKDTQKEISKKAMVVLLTLGLLGGCEVKQSASTPNPGESKAPALSSAIQALLDANCQNRPTPGSGQVLGEQDVAVSLSSLSGVSSLALDTISGNIYVEPSTDGSVTGAIRKWSSSPEADKQKTLDQIAITQQVQSGGAVVKASVSSPTPNYGYEACIVIKAPADWAHQVSSPDGNLVVIDHTGNLMTETASGDTTITKAGPGAISAATASGNISISPTSSTSITAGAASGSITIVKSGSGKVAATSASGSINLTADSSVGVTIDSTSGSTTYTLQNGGAALQTNSTIDSISGSTLVTVDPKVGLNLDAQTTSGSITVSNVDSGKQAVKGLNGGGATLKIRSTSGSVTVK